MDLVNEAITQTRNLARGLSPVQLEGQGLHDALQELSLWVENLYEVECRFLCEQEMHIDDLAAATHLYRIAQESVGNALRHADPTCIDIELANRNNVPYIDTYHAFFQHEEGWEACLEDIKGNHPSPLGHEIMAGLFAPKILELTPAQPKNILGIENNDNYIMVQWSENVEFDFDYCQIEFGFQADDLNRLTHSDTNDFRFLNLPSNPLNLKIYFRIQAIDQDGNASTFSPVFSIEFNQ